MPNLYKMSFGPKLDIAAFIPHISTLDNFGCQHVRYANLTSSCEPYNVRVALANPQWKAAMEDEFAALMRNKTWRLVPPQPGRNVIDCKWVHKIKHRAVGSMERHKARLVAKGFK
jgi:hypothetical protein